MPTVKVKFTETLTPTQRELVNSVDGDGMVKAAARGVVVELKDWFALLEQNRPNKMGFHRQHFWSDVRKTVQQPEVQNPKSATVSITHRSIRQRVEGGYIRPGSGKKYLTIPANDEAYGHSAREFSNLHFGFVENKYGNLQPALIENLYQQFKYGRKRADGTRKVIPGAIRGAETAQTYYFLSRQVYQRPDPSVLPPDEQLAKAAAAGALEFATASTDAANKSGGPS